MEARLFRCGRYLVRNGTQTYDEGRGGGAKDGAACMSVQFLPPSLLILLLPRFYAPSLRSFCSTLAASHVRCLFVYFSWAYFLASACVHVIVWCVCICSMGVWDHTHTLSLFALTMPRFASPTAIRFFLGFVIDFSRVFPQRTPCFVCVCVFLLSLFGKVRDRSAVLVVGVIARPPSPPHLLSRGAVVSFRPRTRACTPASVPMRLLTSCHLVWVPLLYAC